MAKIQNPDADIEFWKGSPGKVTVQKIKGGLQIMRKYPIPYRIQQTVYNKLIEIKEQAENEYRTLTEQEKAEWETYAKKVYTTGSILYKKDKSTDYTLNRYGIINFGKSIYGA